VTADNIWGPDSQDALNAEIEKTGASNPKLAKIQGLIGVKQDGLWGQNSQKALNAILKNGDAGGGKGGNGPFKAKASSFADPADVVAFKKCKAQGKTDQACFKVGDNGIGKWGTDTTSPTKPMVAIHEKDATARWGSMDAAAHRKVRVTVVGSGKSVVGTVEDKLGTPGRIDLNPGAANKLGLSIPIDPNKTQVLWEWVV
jgi:hypothetical protein